MSLPAGRHTEPFSMVSKPLPTSFEAAGAGACPPENSGGTGGFADLKEVFVGPLGQAREEMRAGPVKTTPRSASI
jgi:hypothetical protein